MKKRLSKLFLTGIIASSMILPSNGVFANTQEKIVKVSIGSNTANIDGNDITIDAVPYIQEKTNSTMIPLRFVATALDISENNIKFDATTKTITITKGNDIVEFKVNSNKYKKNGTIITTGFGTAEPTVEIKNGRTFVPFRTLAEAFNLEIEWESDTKTATMKTGKEANTISEISASTTAKAIFDLYILGDKTEIMNKLGFSEEECNFALNIYKLSFISSFKTSFEASGFKVSDAKIEEFYSTLIETFKKLNYSIEETASTDGKTKTVLFKTTYIDLEEIINNAFEKFTKEVIEKKIDESKWGDIFINIYINEVKNYKPNGKLATFKSEFSVEKTLVNGEVKNIWLPSNVDEFSMNIALAIMGHSGN